MKLKRIKPISKNYPPQLGYWIIAGLALLVILIPFHRGVGIIYPDTSTYYFAGEQIFSGSLDIARPPVYPVILHLLKLTFGFDGSRIAIAFLHVTAYLLSLVYIHKAIRLIAPQSPRIWFWVTFFFVFSQMFGFFPWTNRIQTDSFAVSFSTFLIFNVVKAAQPQASAGSAVWTSLWLLVLVFLRPILLCYIPAVAVFWIALLVVRRKEVWKSCAIGLGSVAVVVMLVGLYALEINRTYGIHTLSSVGIVNNYATLSDGGFITPDDINNPAYKEYMTKRETLGDFFKEQNRNNYERWKEIEHARYYLFMPEVEQAVNHVFKTKPVAVATYLVQRAVEVMVIKDPDMRTVALLLLFALVVLSAYTIRKREFLLVPWTLLLFVASVLSAMFIGCMSEWGRIASPMLPMLTLLVGWASSKLRLTPTSDWGRKNVHL